MVKVATDINVSEQKMQAALFKIGTLVRNRAVQNITKEDAVDEGILRGAIAFKIEASGDIATVTVGAFGIKYARMIEYGGAFTDQMRKAMFASMRDRGKPKRPSKGVILGGRFRGRPFLGPAARDSAPEVRRILKEATQR